MIALRRGLGAGGVTLLMLALAAAPARAAGAWHLTGGAATRAAWLVAGVVRDLAALLPFVGTAILAVVAFAPLGIARFRRPRWQRAGGLLLAVPFGAVVWGFGITAQEFKVERGTFPTVFDLSEGASSATFLKGTLGFLRYDVYWAPALVFGLVAAAVVALRARRRPGEEIVAWRPWALGVGVALLLATSLTRVAAADTLWPYHPYMATIVGDPFRIIIDSSLDALAYGRKVTPRDLVRDAAVPSSLVDTGASLLGWPEAREAGSAGPARCARHPHARPLDRAEEPRYRDSRGEELMRALENVSDALFPLGDDRVVVWQITLESFRADDLHAMNPDAPRETAPFVNGLYDAADRGGEGVLASRKTYQAGVRTAQGLGALACGIGTLPYNLSVIRDLHPIALRCLSDVLGDAGFRRSFYYGSDVTFDGMGDFFRSHGFAEQITQQELPKNLPTGAWDAVTDLALVDETTKRVAGSFAAESAPRLVMLTTLSNHSPFGAPADLPAEVEARVGRALAAVRNHAARDDRARLLTHSYTDMAVARLFERLEALGLAERSIVVIAADHSTGEDYVWGPEREDTDDAKARIPFAIVVPRALRARVRDAAAFDTAIAAAQRALAAGPVSQNDVPAIVLALLRSQPAVRSLAPELRWHTLGGQVTSPWFRPGTRAGSYILGVNGVSQLVMLDRTSARVGDYEESVFLKTRSDLTTVTPSLLPVTATLASLLARPPEPCAHPTATPSGRAGDGGP